MGENTPSYSLVEVLVLEGAMLLLLILLLLVRGFGRALLEMEAPLLTPLRALWILELGAAMDGNSENRTCEVELRFVVVGLRTVVDLSLIHI